MLRTSRHVVVGRTDSNRCWRTAPRKIVDCCCYLDALFDGRCCLKFVAADVDEPLVELLPFVGLLSILDS